MNALHSTEALFVATTHLDALRASARAQEVADAAARRVPSRGGRSTTRVWRHPAPPARNVRLNTSERPSEVFCPTC